MTTVAQISLAGQAENDPVSRVLKWILLLTAILSFALLFWGTYKTYQLAPPLPEIIYSPDRHIVMTASDIVAGKAGFQKADLMDYGSLYGMGSYFGEDYTAKYLVRLGNIIENELALERFSKPFGSLSEGEQYETRMKMQRTLKQIDLSQPVLVLPPALSKAIRQLQLEITNRLLNHDAAAGWTKAYSLNSQTALQTANFLIYSSLTTVANRPGKNFSYTNNWPYEPSVGNVPTDVTFYWTWISYCFVFLVLEWFYIFITAI